MANISKAERDRREAESKSRDTDKGSDENREMGDVLINNPREPVPNVREDAEPVTWARGGDPVGTPGTVDPKDVPGGDPVEDTRRRVEANARVETRGVRFKLGWFPKDGGGKIPAGTETEVPIEDARHLFESGIVDLIDLDDGDDSADAKSSKKKA